MEDGSTRLTDGSFPSISTEFETAQPGGVDDALPQLSRVGHPGFAVIAPGETLSKTVTLDSNDPKTRYFSYASMVIPSNDFFIANANPLALPLFDSMGNFLGVDFIVMGTQVLDAGTEINDEIPMNTAFLGQMMENVGVPENGVVSLSNGYIPGGPILSSTMFANADFTSSGYQIARITSNRSDVFD